jgi:hypothetical protein
LEIFDLCFSHQALHRRAHRKEDRFDQLSSHGGSDDADNRAIVIDVTGNRRRAGEGGGHQNKVNVDRLVFVNSLGLSRGKRASTSRLRLELRRELSSMPAALVNG